jgi:uncharacterized delta-60 repeat protein
MKNLKRNLFLSAVIFSTSAIAAPVLDTSFNASGKRNIWFDLPTEKWDEATDAVMQPDGKIIVVGFARKAPISGTGDVSDLTVARLNADGSTDNSFATNGKLSMDLQTGGRLADRANAVALDSAGRIYVAGTSDYKGFVVRLNPNGSVDTSYALSGRLPFSFGPFAATSFRFEDIAIDSSGRAVVVGTQEKTTGSLNEGMALRVLSTGQLDSSFTGVPDAGNSVGFRTLSLLYGQAYNDEITRVSIAADGSIYAGGSFQGTGNDFDFMVYKLSGTNGALVQSFGSGGRVRSYLDLGDKYDRLADMKLLPNGSLRLLGNCRVSLTTGPVLRGCLLGLTAAGAVDSALNSFQTATAFRTFPVNQECNGIGGEARGLIVRSALNNEVVIVGEQKPNTCSAVSQMAIQRQSDTTSIGHLTLPYSSASSWANAAVLDAQGRLLVVGASVLSASDTDQASARLTGF